MLTCLHQVPSAQEPWRLGVCWGNVVTGVDGSGCTEEMGLEVSRSHFGTLEGGAHGG